MFVTVLEIVKENIIDLTKEIKAVEDDLTNEELYNINMNYYNKILTEIRTFYKKKTEFSEEERELLKIVTKKYLETNQCDLKTLADDIDTACTSGFYSKYKSQQASIFDHYVSAFNKITINTEKALGKINGELAGKKFKGHVVDRHKVQDEGE